MAHPVRAFHLGPFHSPMVCPPSTKVAAKSVAEESHISPLMLPLSGKDHMMALRLHPPAGSPATEYAGPLIDIIVKRALTVWKASSLGFPIAVIAGRYEVGQVITYGASTGNLISTIYTIKNIATGAIFKAHPKCDLSAAVEILDLAPETDLSAGRIFNEVFSHEPAIVGVVTLKKAKEAKAAMEALAERLEELVTITYKRDPKKAELLRDAAGYTIAKTVPVVEGAGFVTIDDAVLSLMPAIWHFNPKVAPHKTGKGLAGEYYLHTVSSKDIAGRFEIGEGLFLEGIKKGCRIYAIHFAGDFTKPE